MHERKAVPAESDEQIGTCVEGRDFYFDDGLMVLTRRYLLDRGRCCTNGCRHCPYDNEDPDRS